MSKKILKWVKIVLIVILSVFVLVFTGLLIYSRNPYEPLPAMQEQIDLIDQSGISVEDNRRSIQYMVNDPIKHIIIVPGGLVTSDSYAYLAMSLASHKYNVTIVKPWFHLAIASSNQPLRYIDEDLDNVIIGHSLGGVVASMVAPKSDDVTSIVLLASYPNRDISDLNTLIITAEHDLVMDQVAFNDALDNVGSDATFIDIEGGNHAQFGWYGPQEGDGEAEISTLTQQDLIIQYILSFIE